MLQTSLVTSPEHCKKINKVLWTEIYVVHVYENTPSYYKKEYIDLWIVHSFTFRVDDLQTRLSKSQNAVEELKSEKG